MFLIPVVILLPMVMAVVSACVSKRSALIRDGLVVGTGIATFALCVLLLLQGEGHLTIPAVCGFGLTFEADGFRAIYACIASFMWMMSGIFSPEYFSHHPGKDFECCNDRKVHMPTTLQDDLYIGNDQAHGNRQKHEPFDD